MPTPYHLFFTGRMLFLTLNQFNSVKALKAIEVKAI